MATIKSYTDISQSKKLAEILPVESADMWYHPDLSDYPDYVERCSIYNIPCWSLAALLDVLPEIKGGKPSGVKRMQKRMLKIIESFVKNVG